MTVVADAVGGAKDDLECYNADGDVEPCSADAGDDAAAETEAADMTDESAGEWWL